MDGRVRNLEHRKTVRTGWLLILPLATGLAAAAPADRDALMSERREKLRQKWEQRFRDADQDRSRSLTLAEARAAGLPHRLIARFDQIDADADGTLTPEELWSAYEQQLDEQARTAAARSGRRP